MINGFWLPFDPRSIQDIFFKDTRFVPAKVYGSMTNLWVAIHVPLDGYSCSPVDGSIKQLWLFYFTFYGNSLLSPFNLFRGRSYGKYSWPSNGTECWAGDYIYCNGWDLANSADPERRANYPV